MRIEIEVISQNEITNIFVNTDDNIFLCNGSFITNSVNDFVQKLLDIVVYWDKDMQVLDVIDAEYFLVDIMTGEETHKFEGRGVYPDNYLQFKQLILEAINGVKK